MRIPHHLIRSPTGVWSFRQRVPVDLQATLGRRVLKKTLRTAELQQAQLRALMLSASYAQAFTVLREQRVDKLSKKDADALIAKLTGANDLRDLTLHRTRALDGTISERWQIDSELDLRMFQSMQRPSGDPLMDALDVPKPPAWVRPERPTVTVIKLDDARDAWLASLKANTLAKTWTIKKTAIEALVAFLGSKKKLHTIHRTDLARWYQHMRDAGAATPTLTNKQSYIGGEGGFFEWAQASGYYPVGDNPAAGHVSYSIREKRARRKFGFKPYDGHQVQALFEPAAFEALPPNARWAALIGLYTGARASEVGQLLTADIFEEDGVPCIRISDEGEHQKVKTDVSLRTIPIHPDLLALGFLDWADHHRQAGYERLFPAARADAKNGQGNWITKAFSRHVEAVGKHWSKGKRGFHSLRKTVIQSLQGAGVVSELRAQLVGHELDDEHHSTYSRPFTIREKLDGIGGFSPGLSALAFNLKLDALQPLLREHKRMPKRQSGVNL